MRNNKNVFVDTGVFTDVLIPGKNAGMVRDSAAILSLSACEEFTLLTSVVTVTELVRILLDHYPKERTKARLTAALEGVRVISINESICLRLPDSPIDDTVCALQELCASSAGCTTIVTRNPEKYANSTLKTMSPGEFLETFTY